MENRVIENDAPESPKAVEGKPRRFSIRPLLRRGDTGKYIRYVVFVVGIGMVYIWNSHVAESQVKEENRLRKEIADAKAEYKTMHARLSAGTRRRVIFEKVDSLGLKATSQDVFKLVKSR